MRRKSFIGLVVVLAIIAACIYKYNQYGDSGTNAVNANAKQPSSSIMISEDEAKKIANKTPIKLYFLDAEKKELKAEIRYIPDTEVEKGLENVCKITVNELIKGPAASSGLAKIMPEGLKLNSVTVESNKAELDFNAALVTDDVQMQRLILESLAESLKDSNGIEAVTYKKDGEIFIQ